jgi:DNA-binding transcriptional LysR family regulator
VRVVRHGSLAGAARELELPKSTVSRRVARLEERLNTELLHRAARRVLVTPEGKRLYDRVAGSIDTIELAVRGTLHDADLPRGHIRMTAPTDFGRLVLIDELVSFAEAFPEITVDLELTDRLVDLAAEGFDLALRAGRTPHGGAASTLITRRLMETSLHLASSPTLAEQVRCLEDLKRVPFVLFRAPTPSMHRKLRLHAKSGRVHEVEVHGRFVVHDYASMAELVARGVGLGLLPAMHIDRAAAAGPMVRVLPELSARTGHVAVVYPTRRLPGRVKALIDHLTRRLGPPG